MQTSPSPFLNEAAAAEYLALAPKTLRGWRWAGHGPTFHRFGTAVRYSIGDLEDFAASAAVKS